MSRKTTAALSHPATNTATIHDVKLKRGAGGELHQTAEGDTPVLTTAQSSSPSSSSEEGSKVGSCCAARFNVHGPDISRILPMAFLSPKITEAILTGQQPVDLSIAKLTRMLDLPIGWKDQHALLMT